MGDDLHDLFHELPEDPMNIDLPLLKSRAVAFDRSIQNRNRVELIAVAFVVVVFGAFAARANVWQAALGPLMTVFAALYVGRRFVTQGNHAPADPMQSTDVFIEQHRVALRFQADLIGDVPRWYIAPFLPGICWLYGWVAFSVWGTPAFPVVLVLAVLTALFFLAVAWMNVRRSRQLFDEADAL